MKSIFEKTIEGVLYHFESTDYLGKESMYHVSCDLNGQPFEFRMQGDGQGYWKVLAQNGVGNLPDVTMLLSDAIAENEDSQE